jgi:hypothetical protein
MVPPGEGHEDYRFVVRKLSFAEKTIEAEVVMSLGTGLVRYSINPGISHSLTFTV